MTTQTKVQRLLGQQTLAARKVYDAVPAQQVWTTHAILAEMTRLGAGTLNLKTVQGCLNHLVELALVKEVYPGSFQRTALRPELVFDSCKSEPLGLTREEPTVDNGKLRVAEVVPRPALDPLSRLAAVAARMRKDADEIDAAALAMQDMVDAAHRDNEKLRQLQALLKSLGV